MLIRAHGENENLCRVFSTRTLRPVNSVSWTRWKNNLVQAHSTNAQNRCRNQAWWRFWSLHASLHQQKILALTVIGPMSWALDQIHLLFVGIFRIMKPGMRRSKTFVLRNSIFNLNDILKILRTTSFCPYWRNTQKRSNSQNIFSKVESG